jgi:methyl-accepting chemotaxis protein
MEDLRESITSISDFSNSLYGSTLIQKDNSLQVVKAIETVNSGAKEFVNESEKLSHSSGVLNEMANTLMEKLKFFKIQQSDENN